LRKGERGQRDDGEDDKSFHHSPPAYFTVPSA
jgi:hypothetical protein